MITRDHLKQLKSKPEFAKLLQDRRPCQVSIGGDPRSSGEISAILAYSEALDVAVAQHYELKRLAVLVHDVVTPARKWKDSRLARFRIFIAALLMPQPMRETIEAMPALATKYEADLEPLLK